MVDGAGEKEYQELHFASDETFRKAFLRLVRFVPSKYLPYESTPNPKHTEFMKRKEIDHYILVFLTSLAFSGGDNKWANDHPPQKIIRFVRECSSDQYAQETISLMEHARKIILGPQDENYLSFIAKLYELRLFATTDEWEPFTTEATRFAATGKPSFMIDAKELLERIIKTDFSFNSAEGEAILGVWKEVGRNSITQHRYKIIEEQDAKKARQRQQ